MAFRLTLEFSPEIGVVKSQVDWTEKRSPTDAEWDHLAAVSRHAHLRIACGPAVHGINTRLTDVEEFVTALELLQETPDFGSFAFDEEEKDVACLWLKEVLTSFYENLISGDSDEAAMLEAIRHRSWFNLSSKAFRHKHDMSDRALFQYIVNVFEKLF